MNDRPEPSTRLPFPETRSAPTPAASDAPTDSTTLTNDSEPLPLPHPDLPRVPGYHMLAKLAEGGMGVVYRALQLDLKRDVALKMIRTGHRPRPVQLARFRTEAEAIARLRHPNVVQIFQLGTHDDKPYFAMEYVGGGDLATRLAGGPLPPAEAARLVEILARALDHVHRNGVVHRDLKPANVLLAEDGTPKVADFGLARWFDPDAGFDSPAMSALGEVLGTVCYMPPEQAAGRVHETGPLVDVWALGAILYECLTGRPPFKGETRDLTIAQVIHDDVVPPSCRRPGLPPDLEAICLKCLEKVAGERYRCAAELADDLRRFLDGEPVVAASVNEWEWRERWALRAGYEILDVLTCGVHDVVYKARQVRFGKPVALKVLTGAGPSDPAEVARFQAEAEAVGRLDHPNIVQGFTLGELNGRPYFITEYVEGGNLIEKYADQPAAPAEAAALVATLADAVQHAHERGLLHCALKPSNVLLTRDGTPKVTNFGLAVLLEKEQEDEFRKRAYRRLASYSAPELAEGRVKEVGPASDVYSLGAILYMLLTGYPPFFGDTVQQTLEMVCTQPPVPLSSARPEAPPDLEAICLKCLEKDPARRPASAGALAAALRGLPRTVDDTRTPTTPASSGSRPGGDTAEFELVPGYEVLDRLGEGGLGIVHKALHIGLERLVALKIFRALEPARLERVRATTRALARLDHPNILRVIDCGLRDGRLYVAEELVEGESLARLAGPTMPAADAARLVETAARAIHFAHESGIVHRNLKPRVVLLTADGRPKISSFEMARLLGRGDDDEPPGTVVGTPLYMAPEQAEGVADRIGPATDVYGLGAILYYLLTGRAPLHGGTIMDLLEAMRTGQPPSPARLRPDTPPGLEAICMRCLRRRPQERYPSARELADELAGFLRGSAPSGPASPPRPGFWARVMRWLGRKDA